jgi:hypothetical protein
MDGEPYEIPLERAQDGLDELTGRHERGVVMIEVLDQELGDEPSASGLPLSYIEYDRKDDVVIIAVHGLDEEGPVLRHIVDRPRRILVDPTMPDGSAGVDITAENGSQTILTLGPARDR